MGKLESHPGHTPDQADETRQIQRVALYAFLLNLVLAGTKGVLAITSGSLAVTAGAIDSATDAVASAAIYGGVRLSSFKTRHFPLGLYKIENMVSVFIAFFIFFAGYEIARQVILGTGTTPDISLTIIVFLLAAALTVFLFGRYCLRLGRRTESPTLIAEGKHRQVDVVSSLIVLAAVILNFAGVRFHILGLGIDQIAACLVLVFIAATGWELLTDGMRVLLDASLDADTLKRIGTIIEREPPVKRIISLVGRNAGRFRFIQAEIVIRTGDLQKAHRISDLIEDNIKKEIPHVERVIIHYEPDRSDLRRIALPLANAEGVISTHFGEAPFFAILEQDTIQNRIRKQEILVNPFRYKDKAKGISVAEWLVEKNVDQLIVKESLQHKGPSYVFSHAGIAIDTVRMDRLADVLSGLAGHGSAPLSAEEEDE